MTTFVDFRYARSLGPSVFFKGREEETVLGFDLSRDGYLALECASHPGPGELAQLSDARGNRVASVLRDVDGRFCLASPRGDTLLRSGSAAGEAPRFVVLRVGPERIGFRAGCETKEVETPAALRQLAALQLAPAQGPTACRVLGRGTGRAAHWADIAYQRPEPTGLALEVVLDWHHLRAGVPLVGTAVTEGLLARSDFQLGFRSYVFNDDESRDTDFARLFASDRDPEITLDFSPISHARPNRETANIGAFVCEGQLPPALRDRCNAVDHLVAPTRFVAEAFRRSGARPPIELIPHGVDSGFYRPVERREPLPGGRGFNFFAACSSVARKNVEPLVRAFLEEFREHEDVALFLFVRPEYHTTQNCVEMDFAEWEGRYFDRSAPILFSTEYVEREALRDFYANANAYVMPSSEGFGLTLLEAMACGTPTIGLDYGGVVDFLDESNGYLVPKGRGVVARDVSTLQYVGEHYFQPDVRRLRQVMRHVFENREEAEGRGRRARQDCCRSYTWEGVADRFADLVRRQHARGPVRRAAPSRPAQECLSWALCVEDDAPVRAALRHIGELRSEGEETVALFTRFARVGEVLRARKAGSLIASWDATARGAREVTDRLPGGPWALVLHPDERVEGDLGGLRAFLSRLPEDVSEVHLPGPEGAPAPRVLRAPPSGTLSGCAKSFEAVSIRRRPRKRFLGR